MADRGVAPLCPMPHRDAPRQAVAGSALCAGHVEGLRALIADVGWLWSVLGEVALPGPSSDSAHVRGKAVAPAAPVRLDVLVVRDGRPDDSVPAVLARWLVFIQTRRRLTRFALTAPQAALGQFGMHLPWLMGQPEVVDLYADLRSVHRALREAVGDHGPPAVGRCPVLIEPDDDEAVAVECSAPLVKSDVGYSVRCVSCGASWSESELRRLGMLLAQAQAESA